jgi:dienelactone hydrolase
MRALWLGWLLVACGGDDPAGKGGDPVDDTDTTGDTDAADDTDGPGFGDWEAVNPVVRWNQDVFEGNPFASHVPVDAAALVFLFHGTGGTGENVADTTEMVAVLNELVGRGVGFYAPSSLDRGSGVFDSDARPADNDDWQLLVRARDALIAGGAITETTPLFTMGFSAGGAFASYVANAAVDEGWPMKGFLLHNATGGSARFDDPAPVAGMWMCSEYDDKIPFDGCQERHGEHVADGHVGEWAPHFETRLEPTRFVRSGSFTANQSRDIFRLAVENGYFDASGQRLFPVEEIDDKVWEFTETYDVIYPKPARAVLNVVLATHAINGEHAVAEADFVFDNL